MCGPGKPISRVLHAASRQCISDGLAAGLLVVFYAVLANIPYWAACPFLRIRGNGYFCVEYCAVGILALFVPAAVSSVALLFAIWLDIAVAVSETFGIPISQCLANLGVFRSISSSRLEDAGLVVVLSLVFCWFAAFLPHSQMRGRNRGYAAIGLGLFATTLLLIDYGSAARRSGSLLSPIRNGFHKAGDVVGPGYYRELHPTRLPVVRLVRSEINYARVRARANALGSVSSPVASATGIADRQIQTAAGETPRILPDLVVVLVESWGLHEDPEVADSLAEPYQELSGSGQYHVLLGTVPFFGFTVVGEGRELCANRIGFHLAEASAAELKGCLPERLDALGYQSIGLHGMDGQLFDRETWYKSLGFDETRFKSDFERQGLRDCVGAFTGTCDAEVAAWIGQRLKEDTNRPRFVYWVTLDSHLPILVPSHATGNEPCSLPPGLRDRAALCPWYRLVLNTHKSIAKLAATSNRRPTIFVVVGDHAPPFSDLGVWSQFSPTEVPYVVLMPADGRLQARGPGDGREQGSEYAAH